MKKFLSIILAIVIFFIATGCTKQPVADDSYAEPSASPAESPDASVAPGAAYSDSSVRGNTWAFYDGQAYYLRPAPVRNEDNAALPHEREYVYKTDSILEPYREMLEITDIPLACYGGYLYYTDSSSRLMRYGGGKYEEILSRETDVRYVTFDGGYIYFATYPGDVEVGIYRCGLDGSGIEQVAAIPSDDVLYRPVACGGVLYYKLGSRLRSMELNGESSNVISGNVGGYIADASGCYFTDSGGDTIYRYFSGETEMLLSAESLILDFNKWNELIYFSTEAGLHIYDTVSGDTVLIAEHEGYEIADIGIAGGKLFYSARQKSGRFASHFNGYIYYTAEWDGSDAIELSHSALPYQTFRDEEIGIQISCPAEWFMFTDHGSYLGGSILITSPGHDMLIQAGPPGMHVTGLDTERISEIPLIAEGEITLSQGARGSFSLRRGEGASDTGECVNVFVFAAEFEIDGEAYGVTAVGDDSHYSDELLDALVEIAASLEVFAGDADGGF